MKKILKNIKPKKEIAIFFYINILFLLFWPMLFAGASYGIMPKVKTSDDFIKMGGGKCVFYSGGGCSSGNWYESDKTNCSWEPCCKQHMNGYPNDDYIYRFSTSDNPCANKSLGWGYEFLEPDKTKCISESFSCCCPTQTAPNQTKVTETKSALFTPPDLQITIPGMSALTKVQCPPNEKCDIPWISQYVTGIYNYALSIVGILAAIILMAGGVLWIISAGDASRITQAKDLITGSITGLIILACSYIILIQINPDLVNLKSISVIRIEKITPPQEGQKCKLPTTLNTDDCHGLSMVWPTDSHSISSGYIRNDSKTFHGAIDINIPAGTDVKSVTDGIVKIADGPKTVEDCAVIMIQSGDYYITYLHLSQVNVKVSDSVEKGQIIGKSGGAVGSLGSCKTTGAHLHFQIKKGEYNWGGYCVEKSQANFIDPKKCLP